MAKKGKTLKNYTFVGKCVEILWIDIVTIAGWNDEAVESLKNKEPDPVVTVGFCLFADTKKVIVFSSKHRKQEYVGELTIIPKSAIETIYILERKNKVKY